MSGQYTLYGTPFSLYTAKARAYLAYKQIDFTEVFSSLRVYKDIIIPNTGVRFIPVLKTPQGQYLQDTSVIIDNLESSYPQHPVIPALPTQQLVSYLFELWADEWLLIPAMHYRWNKDNFPFIYQEFGKVIAPRLPAFIRAILGKKVASKFSGFVPLLGITEKTIPAIEYWYEDDVLFHLNHHFAHYDYLLGGAPTIGDFALMGPLYAHLFRDPAPARIMIQKAPHIVRWIDRMNQPTVDSGQCLKDDKIAETLIPLLSRIFSEQWPVLTNTVKALEQWAELNPSKKDIPRSIGEHSFKIGEVTDSRAILTFHQWKLQRVLDCYQRFDEKDKKAVDLFLDKVNGKDAMHFTVRNRVIRQKNRLVFD